MAGGANSSTGDTNLTIISSAEQYFKRGVLKEDTDLTKGLGVPDLELALCLAACWVLLFLTMWKGVASSGKVFILSNHESEYFLHRLPTSQPYSLTWF